MPAVSGSSGRLVVSLPKEADASERTWPGRVFERADLSYSEALDQFVAARQAAEAAKAQAATAVVSEEGLADQRAQRRALRSDWQRLQTSRREARAKRELAEQAWKARRSEHQAEVAAVSESEPRVGRRRNKSAERAARKAQWRAECAARRRELGERREADRGWRQERQALRERQAGVGLVTAWIAVLVVVDNCTRQSLGLPLFALGAHVTAHLVVKALEELLPKELQYLIADGGTHFTAEVMKELAKARGFVRVPLARHRPQSNGIAERFVETLKGWLSDKEWKTAEQLGALLVEFRVYYNDRPHQGLELAGLSPNEYAARMAVT